jgi:hypothetical protein
MIPLKNLSFLEVYIYAKAKLCFKKAKPPKLCGDFLLLELQAYGGMNL